MNWSNCQFAPILFLSGLERAGLVVKIDLLASAVLLVDNVLASVVQTLLHPRTLATPHRSTFPLYQARSSASHPFLEVSPPLTSLV